MLCPVMPCETIERVIEGFPNYTIDIYGNVKNKRGMMLKPRNHTNGYNQVMLYSGDGNKKKNNYVHRLVVQTFLKNTDLDFHVDHIDRNKQNNFVSNLRISTRSENGRNRGNVKGIGQWSQKGNTYVRGLIKINGKDYHKCFNTKDPDAKQKALHWRINKEIELFGKFAAKV